MTSGSARSANEAEKRRKSWTVTVASDLPALPSNCLRRYSFRDRPRRLALASTADSTSAETFRIRTSDMLITDDITRLVWALRRRSGICASALSDYLRSEPQSGSGIEVAFQREISIKSYE